MGEVVKLAPEQHWTKEQVDAAREAIVALVRPDQEISGYQAEAMAKAALLAAAKALPVEPSDYVPIAFGDYRIQRQRGGPGYVVTSENWVTNDPNPLNVTPGASVFGSVEDARRGIYALEIAKAIAGKNRDEVYRLYNCLRGLAG